MDNPTILYEVAKLHHREIEKEMASWRMAHQAKNSGPGLTERFVTAIKTLVMKMIALQKREAHSPDEGLVLDTRS